MKNQDVFKDSVVMTDQQRNKGNELLATLLGWEEEDGSWYATDDIARYVAYSIHSNYPHKDLPFYRDFNYMMKVVDRIETMKNGLDGLKGNGEISLRVYSYKDEAGRYVAYVIFNQYHQYEVVAESRRDSIWECCVWFAEEYFKLVEEKK